MKGKKPDPPKDPLSGGASDADGQKKASKKATANESSSSRQRRASPEPEPRRNATDSAADGTSEENSHSSAVSLAATSGFAPSSGNGLSASNTGAHAPATAAAAAVTSQPGAFHVYPVGLGTGVDEDAADSQDAAGHEDQAEEEIIIGDAVLHDGDEEAQRQQQERRSSASRRASDGASDISDMAGSRPTTPGAGGSATVDTGRTSRQASTRSGLITYATPVVEGETIITPTSTSGGVGGVGRGASRRLGNSSTPKSSSSSKRDEGESSTCRRNVALAGTVLLAILAIAIGVAIPLSTRNANSDGTNNNRPPTSQPTASSVPPPPWTDREMRIMTMLEGPYSSTSIDSTDLEAYFLSDPSSPQSLALDWIANVDPMAVSLDKEAKIIQRYALAVLYYSTRGDGWDLQHNFLTGKDECDWGTYDESAEATLGVRECTLTDAGTSTDSFSAITSIAMAQNRLVGSIPIEIGFLDQLRYLEAFEDELHSTIPTEIGLLANLEHLSLWTNLLTGPMPDELFSNLSSLTYLNLGDNHLTSTIPSDLGSLSKLKHWDTYGNNLSGTIPTQIGLLSSLGTLRIKENPLTGTMPTEIGMLRNLTSLSMASVDLEGPLPTEIGTMESLEFVWLYNSLNLVGQLPSEIGNISTLKILNMAYCPLGGTIPSEFGKLHNLERLRLFDCQLTGTIPSEVTAVTSLTEIWWMGNELTGTIPSNFGSGNSSVAQLFLLNNRLTGTVPATVFSDIPNLREIDVAGNQLTGSPIPADPTALPHAAVMERLILGSETNGKHRFSGQIPPTIGLFTSLIELQIQDASMTGVIPTELGGIPNLKKIFLHNNSFVGNVDAICDDLAPIGDEKDGAGEDDTFEFSVDLDTVQCSCCECCD